MLLYFLFIFYFLSRQVMNPQPGEELLALRACCLGAGLQNMRSMSRGLAPTVESAVKTHSRTHTHTHSFLSDTE